jgi:nucleotide-binding universal stress UspA family protein
MRAVWRQHCLTATTRSSPRRARFRAMNATPGAAEPLENLTGWRRNAKGARAHLVLEQIEMIAVPTIRDPRRSSARGYALLVLEAHGRPSETLRPAAELARSFGLELHVLRVLRRRVGEGVDRRAGSERLSLVQRADAAWCDDVLGECGAVTHLRTGDFSDWVVAFARRSPVKVIIVPPREGRRGNRVTKLTGACGRPMLVLRTPAGFQTLIAATDLEHQGFPVLRTAAELAAHLEARVLVVHNARPLTAAARPEATFSTTIRLRSEAGWLRERRADDARSDRLLTIDGLVYNKPDTADVILRQSRETESALVVVGTRSGHGMPSRSGDVAARVLDGCRSSVLVTPVQYGLGPFGTAFE